MQRITQLKPTFRDAGRSGKPAATRETSLLFAFPGGPSPETQIILGTLVRFIRYIPFFKGHWSPWVLRPTFTPCIAITFAEFRVYRVSWEYTKPKP